MKNRVNLRGLVMALCAGILVTDGCSKKEVVQPCYTCSSFISYRATPSDSKLNALSPYTRDKQVCDESEKNELEKGSVKVETVTGVYSLSTITQTVCVRRP